MRSECGGFFILWLLRVTFFQ